jgi:hypothetical protein
MLLPACANSGSTFPPSLLPSPSCAHCRAHILKHQFQPAIIFEVFISEQVMATASLSRPQLAPLEPPMPSVAQIAPGLAAELVLCAGYLAYANLLFVRGILQQMVQNKEELTDAGDDEEEEEDEGDYDEEDDDEGEGEGGDEGEEEEDDDEGGDGQPPAKRRKKDDDDDKEKKGDDEEEEEEEEVRLRSRAS